MCVYLFGMFSFAETDCLLLVCSLVFVSAPRIFSRTRVCCARWDRAMRKIKYYTSDEDLREGLHSAERAVPQARFWCFCVRHVNSKGKGGKDTREATESNEE